MAATIAVEPINHETCPNPNCKFNNVSGAAKCEKCGENLTGGYSMSTERYSNYYKHGYCGAKVIRF